MDELKPVTHPGEKIKDMLEKWSAEDIATDDDLVKFAVSLL
jgi:hypothetical protein